MVEYLSFKQRVLGSIPSTFKINFCYTVLLFLLAPLCAERSVGLAEPYKPIKIAALP